MTQVFNHFNLKTLRGDIFGGVTAAIVSLPLALAFGVASGAGAEAGLYGAILVGFFAAVFGGSPTLISEPTGPMTVVMTAVLTSMIAANPDNGLAMAFTVVIIAGVFQIILGLFKLGKYITLMPYSVISGFMSGIGVILIILQLAPFLGFPNPSGGVIGAFKSLPDLIQNVKLHEFALGAITLAILFFVPKKIAKLVPPQLIALVVGTLLGLVLFANTDLRVIGEIPLGIPDLQLPVFSKDQMAQMLADGIVLGTLGCIDALLTAVIADSLTRQTHNSDKELVGQGIANIFSGLFGGLPGAGATMGTVVNIQSGARTAISGVTRALILLVVVLGAAKLTENIPMAVLAAIALKVGLNILDWSFVKRAHKLSWQAALIMYGVMLLTVFVDLIVAVGLGVFIANIITIERLSQLQSDNIVSVSDADNDAPLSRDEKTLLQRAKGSVLLVYLSGPMIFGVSKAIARNHSVIDNYKKVIFDLSDVPFMDTTISLALENTIKDALEKQLDVYIIKPKSGAEDSVSKLDVFELTQAPRVCNTRHEALEQAVGV